VSRTHPRRLFVAAYPPQGVTRRLLELSTLSTTPGLPGRATPAELVHLTVHFIGDTDPRGVGAVEESIERATAGIGPMSLTVPRIGFLGVASSSLLVAEVAPHAGLAELRARLVTRFPGGGGRVERSVYRPHLTLARPSRGMPIGRDVEIRLDPPAEFTVSGIHLMESRLRPGGATHASVRSFPLMG